MATEIAAKRYICARCHTRIEKGESIERTGKRYVEHAFCAAWYRRKAEEKKASNRIAREGGSAGVAANGRVVRETKTWS